MSTKKMGSPGGALEEPKSQSLARDGGFYSLTLDEVQIHLGDMGKPLGSMNLDELLKNVWTAESNQAVDNGKNMKPQPHGAVSIQRHSSVTLSMDLSKKTVEEVWKDILLKKNDSRDNNAQDRQPTLGEMTLEDFLLKAGVGAESSVLGQTNVDSVSVIDTIQVPEQNVAAHSQWIHFQPPLVQHQHHQQNAIMPAFMPGHSVQQPLPISTHLMVDGICPEAQMNIQTSSLIRNSDAQTNGRKRVAPGVVVERSVERRQKRMIKNRESAARSRARRQAYTHELEIKVSCLEEENERLRKELEMDKVLPSVPLTEPKRQLRRTSSSLF